VTSRPRLLRDGHLDLVETTLSGSEVVDLCGEVGVREEKLEDLAVVEVVRACGCDQLFALGTKHGVGAGLGNAW
jgi:hypothetical protein